ncbi:MAG: hypothetical protein IPL12_08110 [Bacteroidetes bacterium]|nr:hypothetical protein [Bacteroidota bacterium]
MLFKDIIGQTRIKVQLTKGVADNRVSHAQLFLGPEGSGNLAMALAYAQYINCENKQSVAAENDLSYGDSCGACPSCIKAQKFIHPDIHFTFPFVKLDQKELCADWMVEWRQFMLNTPYGGYNEWITQIIDTENKQGNITAKECQEIMRRLSLKNYEAEYKVLILWLPEYLGNEGNRLLKILEEPPENTVFLLVANDQERIINTIMSRVQIVKFPRLSDNDVIPALVERFKLPLPQAKKIAALSEGNFNEAIQLIDTHEDANTTMIREWMEACYRQNVKSLFAWNDRFVKWAVSSKKNYFQYCLHFFREVLLLEAGAGKLSKLSDAELKTAEGLGKVLGVERITFILELFDKCIYFVERNVNAKIMMTYVSVTLLKQFQSNSINTRPFYEKWSR